MFVSVVIPVYNDPKGIEITVESLLEQTDSEYEIVIADNGSTDDTADIADEFATSYEKITVVVEDNIQGSYAARNKGIEAAEGDIIGFLDADMWVDPDYIQQVKQVIKYSDAPYLGCAVEIVDDGSMVGRYNALSGFPVERYIRENQYAPTCCLIVRRELFDEIGLFDERLISSGDREFGNRVAEAGYTLRYESSITVYHPARSSVRSMISKRIRVARGNMQIRQYHPHLYNGWSLIDPRNVLPPSPVFFRNTFWGRGRSVQEYVFWYLLAWLLKYAAFWGKLRER